jgi:hypothetical protein
MKSHRPSRLGLGAALIVLFATAPAFARGLRRLPGPPAPAQQRAEMRAQQRAATRAQQAPAVRPAPNPPAASAQPPQKPAQNQPHLQRWLENHKNLSPEEQQRALQNEPGFHELTPQAQRQALENLRNLNNMPAQQRDRMLDRNEMLERMTPQQQQQYRGAVQQLRGASQPRQRLMAKAILDLRMIPPGQREQVIDSPAFGAQFSEGERSTIRTLLTAEPYSPAP